MKLQLNNKKSSYNINIDKNVLIDHLITHWALKCPEYYFHPKATIYYKHNNTSLAKEIATAMVELPKFQNLILDIIFNCLFKQSQVYLGNEDVYRFAKIAVKNIPDYDNKKQEVVKIVNSCIANENREYKYSKKKILHAKQILESSGYTVV